MLGFGPTEEIMHSFTRFAVLSALVLIPSSFAANDCRLIFDPATAKKRRG